MTEPWRELYGYWQSKHVDGRPPSRDELDPPLEIPRHAHNLLLVDILPTGLEYRLVGTNFVKGAGLDMTGMMVGASGKHSRVIGTWTRTMTAAHETRQPQLLVARFAPHITATTVMLLLPLTASADAFQKFWAVCSSKASFRRERKSKRSRSRRSFSKADQIGLTHCYAV